MILPTVASKEQGGPRSDCRNAPLELWVSIRNDVSEVVIETHNRHCRECHAKEKVSEIRLSESERPVLPCVHRHRDNE
jgi:hypothetical protein